VNIDSTRELLCEFSHRLTEVASLRARLMRAEIGEAAGKAGMGTALLGAGAIPADSTFVLRLCLESISHHGAFPRAQLS
jgi:hypothetical protein